MTVTMCAILGVTSAFAQNPTEKLTCTPVNQSARNITQLECRITTAREHLPEVIVGELTFQFRITRLDKVSSTYSATLGSVYPASLVNNTIFFAALDWGNSTVPARLQSIPLDTLSFLVQTDQSMSDVKKAFASGRTVMSILSSNAAASSSPVFQTLNLGHSLTFDGSLILESITQYVNPGILQFLRFSKACYEKTPQECFTNIIQNL